MAEYEFRVMQKSLRKGPTSRNKVCCELTCQVFFFVFFVKHTQCQTLAGLAVIL